MYDNALQLCRVTSWATKARAKKFRLQKMKASKSVTISQVNCTLGEDKVSHEILFVSHKITVFFARRSGASVCYPKNLRWAFGTQRLSRGSAVGFVFV